MIDIVAMTLMAESEQIIDFKVNEKETECAEQEVFGHINRFSEIYR